YKKKDIAQRAKSFKDFPDYGITLADQSIKEKIKAKLFLFCLKFCRSSFAKNILSLLPIKLTIKISQVLRKDKTVKTDNYKEIMSYGFWGIITVLVSYLSYALLIKLGVEYKLSNILSLILTKTIAFLTNKYFVFKSKNRNLKELLLEIVRYIWTRGLVGVIDFLGLIIFVELFKI
ncbi:MAG TPA: hypothetical protein DD738_09135, partial [Ruminiclostridium sp.]|nr:hypothetical protein [Ruminiclostridium sp.]